jgi:hypothetical protein
MIEEEIRTVPSDGLRSAVERLPDSELEALRAARITASGIARGGGTAIGLEILQQARKSATKRVIGTRGEMNLISLWNQAEADFKRRFMGIDDDTCSQVGDE